MSVACEQRGRYCGHEFTRIVKKAPPLVYAYTVLYL